MTFDTRYKITKIIVCVSILCSFLSLWSTSVGLGEIYPFFHFKLYSQPLAFKHEKTEYRIYAKPSIDSDFKRISVKETPTFDYYSYYQTFNFLIAKSLDPKEDREKTRADLLAFIKHIEPDQVKYKIVSETYHPLSLINGKEQKYDTATVITF